MGVKKTGLPELDALIKACNKTFGAEIISDVVYEPAKPISTGSISLDLALGIGGIPRGRIIEVIGEESSGKTSLCMRALSEYQAIQDSIGHKGRRALIIDVEHSINKKFIEGFGVNYDMCIHTRPKTVEQALQIARDLPKSNQIGFVIFDSVAAAQNTKQISRDIGSVDVGGISKNMHEALRPISKICVDTETTYMFINQIQYKIGVMFGNPETTSGGKALPFYASLRLRLMAGKRSSKVSEAMLMRVQCKKSKIAPAFEGNIEIHFKYGKGPDPILDLIEVAKGLKLLRFASVSTFVKWSEDDEERISDKDGKAGGYRALQDEKVFNRLKSLCLTSARLPNGKPAK